MSTFLFSAIFILMSHLLFCFVLRAVHFRIFQMWIFKWLHYAATVERNMSSRVLNRYKKIRLNKTSASLHTFRLSQSGPLYAHLLAAHSTNAPHLYIFNRLFLVSLSPERRIYRSIFSRSSSRLFNTPHFLLNVT